MGRRVKGGRRLTCIRRSTAARSQRFRWRSAEQVESAIDSGGYRFPSGGIRRRRFAANSCDESAMNFASGRTSSPRWLPGKSARSCRKPAAKCRKIIDICDFAVGLSRQLYGKTIASERPGHRLDGILASAGASGRDFGVQFSRRGLGMERDARARVRRPDRVEAIGKDAAVRDGVSADRAKGDEDKARVPAEFRAW